MRSLIKTIAWVILLPLFILSLASCGKGVKRDTDIDKGLGGSSAEKGDNSYENLFAGVGPLPDASEPVTFNVFIRDPGAVPSKYNPVNKRIAELTGVTIEFEFLVGDLDQKVGVMIASEDYPDAVFASEQRFIDAGAFIPLEGELPKYKNLHALYSPHYEKMTRDDGHQYILELYLANIPSPIFVNDGPGFYIQKAVLEDAGFIVPRTLDEYFDLIEQYMAKYPLIDGIKTIGFEILSDGWRDFCLRNPPQHLMGAGNDGDVFVDLETYTASLYQVSETAKNYYRKLNEEYNKGVIRADTFTQSYDQYVSNLASGAVLGFFDQGWNILQAENILKSDKKFERMYVTVPIANPGVRDSYLDVRDGTITGNNGIGITKNCKDPDRLLAFYDWMLQREVQDYIQWGEEGKDWERVGQTGRVLTNTRRELNNDDGKKRDLTGITLWNYSPKKQGLYEDGMPCGPTDSEDEYVAALSDYDRMFLESYGIKYPTQLLSAPVQRPAYYPVWSMPIIEGSAAALANSKMVDTCRKYYPRLIITNPSSYDQLWDRFVSEIWRNDPQPYLDEVNKQIAKAMEIE